MIKKRRRRCDHCKKLKHDVRYVEDPFTKELQGISVKSKFCTECYNDAVGDI